jgi:hypothetical protein
LDNKVGIANYLNGVGNTAVSQGNYDVTQVHLSRIVCGCDLLYYILKTKNKDETRRNETQVGPLHGGCGADDGNFAGMALSISIIAPLS